jgi:hypothetical protein
VVLALAAMSGCEGPAVPEGPTPQQQIEQLQREKQDLQERIAELQKRLQSQQEQMAVMRGVDPNNLQSLVTARHVEFGRFTGGYDEDGDGRTDEIRVYLQPRDAAGEVVKVAGRATVTLWDLKAPEGERRLGQWIYGVDELSEHWLSGPLARHFRFTYPWHGPGELITISVEFTEIITGQRWHIQKLVELDR